MRAALALVCAQCMLLVGAARATDAAPPVAGGAHAAPPETAVSPGSPAPANNAAAADVDPADLLFAAPTTVDRIGRIVAAVMVNDKGPFRFIVDTGANYSTMSPRLVSALGLTPSAKSLMPINGVTGTASVPSVTVAKLQVGDLILENEQLPVVWAPLMAGADGILGVAGLRNERLLVDFEHNRVLISRSGRARAPSYYTRVYATRVHGGIMSLNAHVGGVHVLAIIDTGSERTIGNQALRDALYARRKVAPTQVDVYGATTEIAPGEIDASPLIDLGPIRIGSVTLVFGNFHIFDVWGLTKRPAVIVGMDVLGTLSALGIDFRHAEIYIDTKYSFESAASGAFSRHCPPPNGAPCLG